MMTTPELDQRSEGRDDGSSWSALTKVLFRFGLIYFLVYSHPYPLYMIPTPSEIAGLFEYEAEWVTETAVVDEALSDYGDWYLQLERRCVDLAAKHAFGIERALDRPYGSGDPLYAYIRMILHVLMAALLAALWSLLARGGGSYRSVASWLVIGLRFYVAFAMLSYGLSKVMPTQFPPWLRLDRLLAPWGDSSPMNVLWSTMSSSEAYTIFGGAGEVVGGCLLLFRRTATLGALVTAGVMANVVAMNFCFDVPVKLYSSHLLLAALMVVVPDARRLLAVLVLNRPTAAREMRQPGFPVLGSILKLIIVAVFVVPGYRSRLERMESYEDLPKHYGIWDVRAFEVGGEEQPLLATDMGVWKHLVIDRGRRCSIHRQSGSRMPQTLTSEDDGSLTLATSSVWEPEVCGDRLLLTGQFSWRFLGDFGDKSSTLRQENREPRLRWTLVRAGAAADSPGEQGDGAPGEGRAEDADKPWLGTWRAEGSEVLSERYTPRNQAAPSRFTELVFEADGVLRVTLPTGRVDLFRWELQTEEVRPTLRFTAEGRFAVEREGRSMTLRGSFRGHDLRVGLEERDLGEFQLLNRGFHWVNAIPWNRY